MDGGDADTVAHILEAKERTSDVRLKEMTPFSKMLLSNVVRKGLQKAGFVYPTIIQATAIPAGLSGLDLLVQSKSGTGKTVIFCTILLESYRTNVDTPQALIIAPTREIAVQIETVLNNIGRCSPGFRAVTVIGGLDVSEDRKRLVGAKAIVGTPGRLLHLLKNDVLNRSHIHLVILDEADKLNTPTFRSDVEAIQNALPAKRQTIACSATFNNGLDQELAKKMRNPLLISTENQATLLVGIKQFVCELPEQKTSILEMQAKLNALRRIFSLVAFKQCLIFASSQSRADSYRNYLEKDGWPCELISGALNQQTRLDTFHKFREFKIRVIIATDLMSRGVDSEHVNLVINLELPGDVVTYLHRIGRAGRFGSHGIAISCVASQRDHRTMTKLITDVGAGMKVLRFPRPNQLANDENYDFWKIDEEQHYEFGFYTGIDNVEMPTVEKKQAPLATTDDLSTSLVSSTGDQPEVTTAAAGCIEEVKESKELINLSEHNSSIDVKAFQEDTLESAFDCKSSEILNNTNDANEIEDDSVKENGCEGVAQEQQEQPLIAGSQNSSLQQLPTISSNTIDDASSIAADSLHSNNCQTNVKGARPYNIFLDMKQVYVMDVIRSLNLENLNVVGRGPRKPLPLDIFADYENYIKNYPDSTAKANEIVEPEKPNMQNVNDCLKVDNLDTKLNTVLSDQPKCDAIKKTELISDIFSNYQNYLTNNGQDNVDNDNNDSTSLSQATTTKDSVDTATFVLSVATPSQLNDSLEELQDCSSLIVDGPSSNIHEQSQTSTLTNESLEVKHFPSLKEAALPTTYSKLTLNVCEQFEIPPNVVQRCNSLASSLLSVEKVDNVEFDSNTSNKNGDELNSRDSETSSGSSRELETEEAEGGNTSGFNERTTTTESSGIESSDDYEGEEDENFEDSANNDLCSGETTDDEDTTVDDEDETEESYSDNDDDDDNVDSASEHHKDKVNKDNNNGNQRIVPQSIAYKRAYERWMDTYWQQLTFLQNYVQHIQQIPRRRKT